MKFGRQFSCGTFLTLFLLASCATPRVGPPPQDATERRIADQAMASGVMAGGIVGAITGHLIDDDGPRGAILGGFAGAVLGGTVGHQVGRAQIANLRNIRLKNRELEKLISETRSQSLQMAVYNSNLESEIKFMLTRAVPAQKRAAQEKQREVKAKQAELQAKIENLGYFSEKLVREQRKIYRQELTKLEQEAKNLQGLLDELEKIVEQGRIGSSYSGHNID